MNKKLRVIAAVVVSCSLMSSTVLADDLSNAKSKSEEIQTEIENNKTKVAELEKNKDNILSEISDLDGNMDKLYSEVNKLNSQISESTEKIKELEQKSNELRKELEANKDLMNKRLRVLYKDQGTSYLEVLLSAEGFSDFFAKLDTINTLISFNTDVINEYKVKQEELGKNIEASANEKKTLEEAKTTVDASLAELNAKKEEKKGLMAKAEEDLGVAEKLLAQNEAESKEILASITAMEESAKRPSRGDSNSVSQANSQENSQSNSQPSGGESSSSQVSTNGMYSITGTRYAITSPFGYRISPVGRGEEFHNGIDIGAPYGAPVYSLKDGTVTYAGEMNGYGKVVVVSHGDISTLYAHNSSISVSVGQTVSGGQQLANVGATGWATGPHIHFEVMIGGERVDSAPYYF
ncbi:peptidoglycan DD-metalloendopeptidase family protein [Clostridium sp. UBA1056]|uniref:murein hydrolase activator EnvC family protein n=1 Tax=unclassified Clostridium TaxID=2614128 RepID=UPI0032172E11